MQDPKTILAGIKESLGIKDTQTFFAEIGSFRWYMRPFVSEDRLFVELNAGTSFTMEAVLSCVIYAIENTANEDSKPSPIVEVFSKDILKSLTDKTVAALEAQDANKEIEAEELESIESDIGARISIACRNPEGELVVYPETEIKKEASRHLFNWMKNSKNIEVSAVQYLYDVYGEEVDQKSPFFQIISKSKEKKTTK